MKTLDKRVARELFEKHYGQRISDATWYRLKKVFDPISFQFTEQNIIWLANLKKQFPQINFKFASVVTAVKESQQFLQKHSNISGDELLNLFDAQDITVHANTLTKWFKSIHGFSRKRIYKSSELASIVLAAYAYKLRKENNQPIDSLTLIR
jgi:hypothetical protein